MSTQIRPRFRKGDKFKLTADALENYGQKYADRTFVVFAVSTAGMPAEEFYAKGRPDGFHPGFDESAGCALYDADGLNFSLYEWEIESA